MLEENDFIRSILETLLQNFKAQHDMTPILSGKEARLIDTACMTLTEYMENIIISKGDQI